MPTIDGQWTRPIWILVQCLYFYVNQQAGFWNKTARFLKLTKFQQIWLSPINANHRNIVSDEGAIDLVIG